MTFKPKSNSEIISKLFGFKIVSWTDLPFLLFVFGRMGWRNCVAVRKSLQIVCPVKRVVFCFIWMVSDKKARVSWKKDLK